MKNYIVSIIPNLKKYSRKLNDISLLTQDGWALIDSSPSKSKIYYFKSDNELLITYRGKVKHGSWEIIHNNIVIKEDGGSFIFKLDFFNEHYLILGIDNQEGNIFFVKKSIYQKGINSFSAIENELDKIHKKHIGNPSPKSGNGVNEMLLFILLIGLIIGMLFYIQYSTNG